MALSKEAFIEAAWDVVGRKVSNEAIAAQILPDVLRRIQLGRVGRKWQEDDVVWHNELRRAVPARTVEDQ